MLISSPDKNEGAYHGGKGRGGGEEGPLCGPGSESLLGERARVVRGY